MKIDIILPVYNPNQWVWEAIASIKAQTHPHWHLTIIDDHSTQEKNLIAELEKMAAGEEKMSYIRLDTNRRAAAARNIGAARGTGEVITFIDQDDTWHPEKLARTTNFFQSHPHIHLVHSNIEGIDENGTILQGILARENTRRNTINYETLDNRALARELFRLNSIRLGTVAVRRGAWDTSGGFDEKLFGGEEEEFYVRFAHAFKIGHLPEQLTYRRLHGQNTSTRYNRERTAGMLRAVEKMGAAYPWLGRLFREKHAAFLRKVLIGELAQKDRGNAVGHARTLLRTRPCDIRSYGLFLLSVFNVYPGALLLYYQKLRQPK